MIISNSTNQILLSNTVLIIKLLVTSSSIMCYVFNYILQWWFSIKFIDFEWCYDNFE